MRELDEEAKKAGIVVMNEIGVDPGVDHIYATKTIDEVHAKGGKVSILTLYSIYVFLTSIPPFSYLRSRSLSCTVVRSLPLNAPTIL